MPGRIIAGGDVRQLTIGGRELTVAPESSIKLSVGGRFNEAKLAGNKTTVITQKPKLGGFSDASVVNDPDNKDFEYIQGLSDAADPVAVALTLAGGQVYAGQLMVTGELDLDTETGTFSLAMQGSTFEAI